MRGLQILTGVVAFVAVIGVGAFLYMTRAVTAPSHSLPTATPTATTPSAAVRFDLTADETQADYTILAVVDGRDRLIVGSTHQVTGSFTLDPDHPAAAQLGDIRLRARAFTTGDERQDAAIAHLVLRSQEVGHEFITFHPTAIAGLPETTSAGETLSVQVTGDLTIAGTTRPVTFATQVTLIDPDRLEGQALATITRTDFNLTIPELPFALQVADDVVLRLDFVAQTAPAVITNEA